jgi:hypothetical protein
MKRLLGSVIVGLLVVSALPAAELIVDREKRMVIVPAKIAPRKIDDPAFKEIYPIEVIATWPFPRGKKAHETVLTFDNIKPSDVHKALVELGLKPGRPARNADEKQSGPEVRLLLDLKPGKSGSRGVPVEQFLVDRKTEKPMPRVKWLFTGSAMAKPDPDKPEVYGADTSGTLIAVFPVTGDTVFQSSLTLADEKYVKLEVSKKLPPVGTPVNLIIVAPAR